MKVLKMKRRCEKCKQARVHLSVIFVALIVANLVLRTILNVDTTSISDVLLLPSLGLIVSAILIYIFIKNKS